MKTPPVHAIRFVILTLALALTGAAARADFTVTFDELALAPNSAHTNGAFQSQGVGFSNNYDQFWNSGFAYSNINTPTQGGFQNPTAAITGTGIGGSGNYAVATGYLSAVPTTLDQLNQLPTITLAAGTSIAGMFVTNTTYAAFSMLNGDQFAKKFGGASGTDPDFFKITAYGTDAAGQLLSNVVDFFLADYRASDSSQDYIVRDWRYMDLSALAGASQIHFNVYGSDVGRDGLNTPAYFAVDNVIVATPQSVPEPASLALVAAGLAGVAIAARRKSAGH
ncbi:DUF4465 domain-containing protein [Tundrisphaera sp. TA3]|uniref:DUF4465 domain-containing protein n=1 Tax=Tundrisphaera sp. TA3 TaxID=3435775 RepID=UPI003EBE4F6D